MPIYEYECTSCHHTFDVLQKINDEPIKECPNCSKNTTNRLVSAAGFQLKGTGWYVTDFKNKGKPEPKTAKKETSKVEKTETKAVEASATTTTKKGDKD